MNPQALRLIDRVISKSSREHPADEVLRRELKSGGNVSRAEASELTHLVFSYYRWRGWLDQRLDTVSQVKQAAELARTFASAPESFSDEDLILKAVPAWSRSEMDVTPALARALQAEPLLWIRATAGQGRELARRLNHCRAADTGLFADTLSYHGREDLFRSPEFQQGKFELQDISSQAVGFICAPKPGETWWDACAGEGGKLLHLADLMENRGLIWATDRAEWRLRRLKRRAARAKVFNYRTALWREEQKLPTRTRFDGILLDAPCSGVGTWQRNPHARWTLEPGDIAELATIQLALLLRVAPALKPGGKLFYSVCSMTRSETSQVVEKLERACPDLEPIILQHPLKPQERASHQLQLTPQDVRGNGMFVAGWIWRGK